MSKMDYSNMSMLEAIRAMFNEHKLEMWEISERHMDTLNQVRGIPEKREEEQ